jgi:hypothetical protein
MARQLTGRETCVRTAAPATPAVRGRIREACDRFDLAHQDRSYGARRAVEVRAPWIVDEQRQSR